tara:strand:+ start:762 stop:986 length:225 start_codon:yes stop_codon:yes gene_type:complete
MIKKVLDNKAGQIIVSVLLGLGLAALFRKVCDNDNCIIINSPPREEIENKIFTMNNRCFRYKPEATQCKTSNQN